MKKKFIFLAMLLLTVLGGVKLNVLNAQETVTIGEGNSNNARVPFHAYEYYSYSQQIYTADEIIDAGGPEQGSILSVALKTAGNPVTRDITVYMKNTTKETFDSPTDWEFVDNSNIVFNGSVNFTSEWSKIEFENIFQYSGDNILLCIQDNTGSSYGYIYFMTNTSTKNVGLSVFGSNPYNPSNIASALGTQRAFNNYIQLTIEVQDDIIPAAPTNLVATTIDHKSVSLTWEAGENAKKYNVHVYNNGAEIAGSPYTTNETACTVEGLEAETTYTFKVQSVRGSNLSEDFSNEASATTLEAPKTRNIVFTLIDSYSDGWNGAYLQVDATDGTNKKLECGSNTSSISYEVEITEGETVYVTYMINGNYWPEENTYCIHYDDGTEIYCSPAMNNSDARNYTFIVESVGPKVTVEASDYDIYSDEQTTLTATAANFDGDVTYSWSPTEGLSDITIANPVFTPTTTGIFEFTCTATDAQNNEASETITINVTERPALSLTVNANKTQIYAGHYATLQALVIGGFDPYTYSWSLGGQVVETADTYSFSASEPGEYTITCKVTDDKGEEVEKSETITVIPDPFVGKQFRIKVVNGTYANYYLNINTNKVPGTYDYSSWTYITESQVGVAVESDYDGQKFTIENDGDGHYYLKSADGYYIKCDYRNNTYNGNWWSVYAYSNSEKTPLVFEYVGENFYIRDYDKMTNNSVSGGDNTYTPNNSYFKVNSNSLVYCDAAISVPEVVLWTVEEILPKPENLVATPAQIYAGDVTTLTWNEFDGAASYNVYVNSELNGSTTGTSYELLGLAYNMNPGHKIEVVALNENGDVISGKASVTVQVAGTFTLTVNVTDGTNPIEGATVSVTTDEWTYDEFGNNIASLADVLTDENGQAVFNNVKLLNTNGYCAYSVSATMGVYGTHTTTPITNYEGVVNGDNVTREIVMTLSEPQNVTADKDLYVEGEDVVLTWDAPEFNTRAFLGYNVYSVVEGDYELGTETAYTQLNEETLTETTYTIENVEYGAKFAVSAVYNEGESSKVNANVQITAYATLTVIVKDANTYEGVNGAVVEVQSYRTGGIDTYITSEAGIVEEALLLGDYTVTVKKNDSHYEVVPQDVELVHNGAEIEFLLTPKASIENVTVTADNNGNVSWTGDYAKWNVYRRNTNAPQELTSVATEVTTTSTTDTEWEMLEAGTYQYGVSALVEQAQTRGTEVIFEEGFENGIGGWTAQNNSWAITSEYHNSGSNAIRYYCGSFSTVTRILTSSNIQINESPNPILSFYLINNGNNTPTLSVIIKENDVANNLASVSDVIDNFTKFEYSLDQYVGKEIQIIFSSSSTYGSNTIVDDIVISSEIPEIETQIVWSNEVVKQGPVMFYAYEDNDWNNPNNWNTKELPTANDEVVILTSVNISSDAYAKSLNIASSSTVTVDEKGVLNVAADITNNGSLVLNDGGQIFQNNANIYAKFNMGINNPTLWSDETSKDGWQFISSPFNAAQISLFTGLFVPKSYDLYKYDGTQELEWINHKSETEFEDAFVNGRGYLASYETLTSVELSGYLYNGTTFSWDGLAYDANKDFANFHLLGNPFPFNMDMSKFTGWTYNVVEGYAVLLDNGGYEYRPTGTIAVGDGFFVKTYGPQGSMYYDHNASVTRRGAESNNSLNITATGKAGKDNVVINLAGKSEGFDKLQNFNDEISTVYVAEDGKKYGIYNCDADVQEVELSFAAATMGNYTIAAQPNGEFETVVLVDRATGVETNLLVEDYTFTATSNDNHNRFVVKFVNGQQSTVNSHFVYQSGEELILNIQGEVQIVDVLGRVVYNGKAVNDINRINVGEFSNGTYMVRVVNEEGVKVEKIIL